MAERIIVIGSNSFSGASFVPFAIDEGFEVIGVSRSNEPDPVFLPYKFSGGAIEFHQLDHSLQRCMIAIDLYT